MTVKKPVRLTVNNQTWQGEISPATTLLDFIRDTLELTGSKKGCDEGACGACAVLVDGDAICSCLAFAVEMDGRHIVTVEGIAPGSGQLHPLQRAFIERDALQCGFCTSGQIITALSLLGKKRHPNREEIRNAMVGNVCRCGCYNKIIEAIAAAGEVVR